MVTISWLLTFQYNTNLMILTGVFRDNYSVVIFAQPSGPLFTTTDRPTGHCPNAHMASPPLSIAFSLHQGTTWKPLLYMQLPLLGVLKHHVQVRSSSHAVCKPNVSSVATDGNKQRIMSQTAMETFNSTLRKQCQALQTRHQFTTKQCYSVGM